MINDRNCKELTEAEQIRKRWQEYTELYKKKAIMSQMTWLSGHHVLHPKSNFYAYILGGLDFVKPFLIWKCHFLLLSYFQLKPEEHVRPRLHSHCSACIVLALPTSQTLWAHRISPSRVRGLILPSPPASARAHSQPCLTSPFCIFTKNCCRYLVNPSIPLDLGGYIIFTQASHHSSGAARWHQARGGDGLSG